MNKSIGIKEEIYCMLLFLVDPIISYINIPGHNAMVSCLFLLVFMQYYKYKHFRTVAFSLPLTIWLILTIYQYSNGIIKNVPGVDFIDVLHGLKIYACIAIFTYWATSDFTKTVQILLKTFLLYLIIAFFVCDFNSKELGGRMSGAIYATQLGQTAALFGVYIAYLFIIGKLKIRNTISLYIFAFIVILFTQSRNSLAMLSLCIIGLYIAQIFKRRKQISKNIIIGALCVTFVIILGAYFVENSNIGQRIITERDRAETSYFYTQYGTGTFFDRIVGDRLVYYVMGWKYFVSSPITGIGIWNFKYIYGGDYPLHSEYMVQLCEGGIIAAILWCLFIYMAIKYIRKSYALISIKIVAYTSIVMILFCGIYAREFFYEFFYPVYGLLLSLYFSNKIKKKQI